MSIDYLVLIGQQFVAVLSDPWSVFLVFSGGLVGLLTGVIPGLTATMALALLISASYGMELQHAVVFLLGVYMGVYSGGLCSSIMLNIPGTPAAAATALDGFPLAKKGMGGLAIGTGVIASFLGSMFSLFILMLLTPLIYPLAMKFGNWEMFLIALFGIMISGSISNDKDPIKGWIVGFVGFALAMVGSEIIYAYPRFTLGSVNLKGGIPLIPTLIGMFGISEVLCVLREDVAYKIEGKIGRIVPTFKEYKPLFPATIRSSLIGFLIGIIPGVGEDVGAWVSYDVGKKRSKQGDKFGTGVLEGVVCAEVADNAVVGGCMVPVLTLAVPGSPPSAMFLAAMMLHGVRCGPMLNMETPFFLPLVGVSLILASCAILFWGLLLARPLVAMLKVKRELLMPLIIPLTIIGAFASNGKIFDVYVMLGAGVMGYIFRQLEYPMAPLVLGLILGPMADEKFRSALMQSRGEILPLLQRPIGLILMLCIAWMIWKGVKRAKEYYRVLDSTE